MSRTPTAGLRFLALRCLREAQDAQRDAARRIEASLDHLAFLDELDAGAVMKWDTATRTYVTVRR